ncbi:cyclophilin-like protein [Martensiomyces pterosporus]|nr:cyclophilin-like protein [Martensiomyces pterosporus]
MSNIYVNEPPTSGKVVLETTAGDIEIELWCKETPKACRNFIQLSLEGYYDNTAFHRVVPGWIVQGGDPTGTGEGGESIYGAPFADEFHSRLRFNRRGLLGMANSGPNNNGSQFFITLGPTPELQKKNTVFGTVVGDSLFNALKLGEGEVDKETERPVYLKSINRTRVLDNPFGDIVLRTSAQKKATGERADDAAPKKKKRTKAVKNKKLLSFGDDDEDYITPALGTRIKSSHDVLDSDPMLSKVPAKAPSKAMEIAPEQTLVIEKQSGDQPASSTQSKQQPEPVHKGAEEPSAMQTKIRSVEEDIKKLVERENKRKSAHEQGTASSEDEGKQPKKHQSALSEMLSQYKGKSARSSGKKDKPSSSGKSQREDELLARLGSFQSKIRSTKASKPQHSDGTDDGRHKSTKCELHGIPGCQSCQRSELDKDIDSLGHSTLQKEDSGWLAHSLAFRNSKEHSASEYAPRVEDYVVIDPRQRAQGFKQRKHRGQQDA